jgi:hypothetical protein
MLRDLWGECAAVFVCRDEGTCRERGAMHMALALSETVAVGSVHRILFCGGVWNSWHLVTGDVCNVSLFLYLPYSSNSKSGCCKSIPVFKIFKLILPPAPGSSLVSVSSWIIQVC